MELEKRFTIGDSFVTILCLLGFLYSISLFNGVLNQSLDKINETPIGTITFKYKSAQRKLIDRVLWDRVKQNSPVYNGDIIRTAELSEATVTFIDGNVIDLYEQTLAQVFLDIDEGAAIDFSGGGVSLNTSASSTGMLLTSGSASVQVGAGAILNAASPVQEGSTTSSALSLQMTSGQAQLLSAENGESVSLTEGSDLVFDSETQSFIPPAIRVVSPAANTKYLTQSDTINIPFSWEKDNIAQGEYIILETSQQRDFSTIVEQISFTNVDNISLSMSEGTWYWRVYTESLSATVGGKIQVLSTEVPTNNVPSQGATYNYRTKAPQVRFMWNDDEYARSWQFEIADNEQMANPIISQITSQPSSIINTLTAGRYYWRVTPTYSTSFLGKDSFVSTSSTVSSFDIVQQGELTQAELVLPLNGGFIDATDSAGGHHFTWKYDYEAFEYEIVISKNENLSSPIVQQNVKENFFVLYPTVADLNIGEWYWAVTKIDSEGNKASQSEVRSLFAVEGRIEQRTLFPPDGYTVAENLIIDTSFSWKTNLPFSMMFQIASDRNFSNLLTEKEVTSSSISGLTIPVGTWYWRIVANSEETGIAYETEPKVFSVSNYLEKVFVTDVSTDVPVVVRPSVPMEFTWDEVESADYYQVRLFNTDDRETPVYENLVVEGTNINIDMEGFEEGEYALTLRAMASESDLSSRQTGLLSEQIFEMEKLVPITLLGPDNGQVFDGVEVLQSPPTVQWSSVEAPHISRLIVSSSNFGLSFASRSSGRRPLPQNIYIDIENPEESVQLPPLPGGTWYWTVIAETEEGIDISPLEPSRFIVNEIEPFEAPTVINPPSTLLLNMNYLRSQRYVDFTWDTIDDATEYVLRISDSNDKVVFEHIINSGNTYRLENLTMLYSGTFYWSLEARQAINGNVIVRRGKREERELQVDIPSLKAPTEQTTGELYGL